MLLFKLQNKNVLQMQDDYPSYYSPSPSPFSPILIEPANEVCNSVWVNYSVNGISSKMMAL